MSETARGAAALTEQTPRLDGLTGLRWWAAFGVFLFHMRVFAPLPEPVSGAFDYGYLGVTFFFVLSGYVLTWSMRPGISKSTFYWRRFARIWPSTMVALVLAVPVFYTLGPIVEGSFLKPFDFWILLLSVVMLQAWFANPLILFSGNPAAWTLSVEALFYLLHPWISRVLIPMSKRGAIGLSVFAIFWAFGYRAAFWIWPESWLAFVPMPITRVPEFLLGMGLAWGMRNGWRPRIPPLIGVGSLFVSVILMMIPRLVPELWPFSFFANEIFILAVALAIVSIAGRALRGHRSMFEQRWQVKLGEWSFAFYLIHATVIYFALGLFGFQEPAWRNAVWFVLILIIDIVLAWMLYALVEHPVERRMRRWKNARDSAAAVRRSAAAHAREEVSSE